MNAGIAIIYDKTEEKIKISLESMGLTIRGGAEYRRMLAGVIDRFARDRIAGGASHVHVEAYPGHLFLAPDSVPLIIERTDA